MSSAAFSVTVGVTATQIVGAAPKRKRLTFHPPANNRVTVSENPGVTLDGGVTLQQAGPPFIIDEKDYGELPKYPWFAIANVAGVQIGITEEMGP